MSTVLSNPTEPASHERVKEYYYLGASVQWLTDHDQPITMATLQDWKSGGQVCGPLSRDEFVQRVRERHIDELTIVWEVWDGTTVWPYLQAEKLTLFREVNRVTLPLVKSPQTSSVTEPTENVSADELLGSVLQENQVELPLTKPGLLWRIPLIGWLLALCGWKARPLPMATRFAGPVEESPTSDVASGRRATPTSTLTISREAETKDAHCESSSTSTESVDPSRNGVGGLSLDGLEDADATASREHFDSATAAFRQSAPEIGPIAPPVEESPGELPPDGQMQGAIANAVDYFDAKTVSSLAHQDKLQATKPRLRDQLTMAALKAGRFVVWPFRGIIALAEKAVSSERSLVTGENFQRWDASLRRGLTHPLTWGVMVGGAFLAILYLVMAMQPDRPDELDFYAVKKLKEAQEAIQAVRATKPDEQAWAQFTQSLSGELTPLKDALQKNLKTNRPIKEGLYLTLEYRLPRILKEGRLKPSYVESEFARRIRDAERQLKSAQKQE